MIKLTSYSSVIVKKSVNQIQGNIMTYPELPVRFVYRGNCRANNCDINISCRSSVERLVVKEARVHQPVLRHKS